MRALKLALLILAIVPTTWLRETRTAFPGPSGINLVDLMPQLRGSPPEIGALQLEGAWRFTGQAHVLGTLSGLAQSGRGLLAVGDRGGIVWFDRPDRPSPWHARLARLVNLDWRKYHYPTDAESVFIDPASGDLIVGYEGVPMLERYSLDLGRRRPIALPVLAEWPDNEGPEAMARLSDGRTVIIGESYDHWLDRTRHPGLIFPGTPRPFETPARFELVMPAGYRPSELVQMPDGRLLVLGRHFSFAGFRSVMAVFAPQDLHPGATITPRVIARIDDPRIRENYEGMTVTREADGSQMVWLVSDSNEMAWAQRTLLLKLRMGPVAHGAPAR